MSDLSAIQLPTRRSIVRYLRSKGWQTKTSSSGKITKAYLSGDTDEDFELFFTSSESTRERVSEITTALRTISQLYEMSVDMAAKAASAVAFDLVFSRIPDEYVRNDSIELRLASTYIKGMRELLTATATTELVRQPSFKRARREAVEYASTCRFGHTFQGSFGFVIESPVGLNEMPTIPVVPDNAPFERKVIERLVRGLQSFRQAVQTEDATAITSNPEGLSANMCDDLIGVVEDTELSKVAITIQLSPEWRSEVADLATASYSIERRYLDLLKEASSHLRRTEAPSTEKVIGRVIRLASEGDPSDLLADVSDREVVINWDSPEYGLVRVQAIVTPRAYLDAVEAHRTGRLISATGTLRRKGRAWVLSGADGSPLLLTPVDGS